MMFSPHHPFQLVFGLLVWAFWFVAVYATMGITCALVEGEGAGDRSFAIRAALGGFSLLLGGYLLYSAWVSYKKLKEIRRERDGEAGAPGPGAAPTVGFLASLSLGVNVTAGLCVWLGGLAFLLVAPCVR